MKRIIHIAFLSFCFFSFKISVAQKTDLLSYQSYFNNQLSAWAKTTKGFSLAKFRKGDTLAFDDINYMNVNKLKDFYAIYKPLLKFSADSNQFIDIYSYEYNLQKQDLRVIATTEVEQGISLCNTVTKQWQKILQLGPDDGIEDVCWVSNQEFILAGYTYDTERKRRPAIYIGNLLKNSFAVYIDDTQVSLGYQMPELKRMHVEQE